MIPDLQCLELKPSHHQICTIILFSVHIKTDFFISETKKRFKSIKITISNECSCNESKNNSVLQILVGINSKYKTRVK